MLLSAAYGFNHEELTVYSNERSQNNPNEDIQANTKEVEDNAT